ncbi:MAG: lipid-A-disaccharide synthase [Ignavibacteriaceae bacterium]|nr:lipid-A-disaccharide synthase [Ignavibacteriaceae bacterium]
MKANNKNILIIAGEASGDLHGSALITELKKIDPSVNVFGIGGEKMKNAGMNILYPIDKLAFLGFAEVIKHIPFIKRVQREILTLVKEKEISNAVLIDYPGFNLSLAKKLKAAGVNIFYYIAPQIWAWGAGRIKKIKALVNKMIVVFPFEEELYRKNNVNVEFVGHPILERINEYELLPKDEFYNIFNLDLNKNILLIFPGSRKNEISRIFPDAIKAASKLSKEFNLQTVVACADNIDINLFNGLGIDTEYKIIKGHNYDLMNLAKIGIIKSGTSTLEAGLFSLPMVIVYKTSLLTYLIIKKLIKLDIIGMVNIIIGEKVAPELIQDKADDENIYLECKKILSDNNLYLSMKSRLSVLKEKLGQQGASRKAALIVYSGLNGL